MVVMTKDKALKLALEALENAEYGDYDKKELNEAISALREALAQEKPTAWVTAGPHTVPLVTQPVQPDNTSKLYEELRSIIDGGSESFTHNDAVQYLKDSLAQPEQEPVGTVGDLFDERVISKRELDRDLLVYTSPPQRQLKSTTDMMMELADRLGELPDDVDPRAWSHLLVYAPKKQWVSLTEWEREAIAVECGAMSADWLVFMEAIEKALKEKNL